MIKNYICKVFVFNEYYGKVTIASDDKDEVMDKVKELIKNQIAIDPNIELDVFVGTKHHTRISIDISPIIDEIKDSIFDKYIDVIIVDELEYHDQSNDVKEEVKLNEEDDNTVRINKRFWDFISINI